MDAEDSSVSRMKVPTPLLFVVGLLATIIPSVQAQSQLFPRFISDFIFCVFLPLISFGVLDPGPDCSADDMPPANENSPEEATTVDMVIPVATSAMPSGLPTSSPSETPTAVPSGLPTQNPTEPWSTAPTGLTVTPTPSQTPSKVPTDLPTQNPTETSSSVPTGLLTTPAPSETPSTAPTGLPSLDPSRAPSTQPVITTPIALSNGVWIETDPNASIDRRHEACFVMVGSKAYLLGGRRTLELDIFDPQSRSWTKGQDLPIELHHMQCVAAQGKIWIVAAWTGDFPREQNTDVSYVYDPAADAWSTITAMPENRRRGGAAVVISPDETKIYVSHGNDGGHERGNFAVSLGWLDVYDIATDSWTALSDNAPNPRGKTILAIFHVVLMFSSTVLRSLRGQLDRW